MENPISAWQGMTALIIGDLMIDRYLYGAVERISPEAPVPILSLSSSQDRLGGAANVALNIKALGASPLLAGVLGDDAEATRFISLMEEAGMPAAGITKDASRPTTVKTRLWAGNQQLLRIDSEACHDIPAEVEAALWGRIVTILAEREVGVIILQDYNKGVLTSGLIEKILAEAGKKDIPVAVDPKNERFFEYVGVALFKPNLKEISAQLRFPVSPLSEGSLARAAAALRERLAPRYTMITLSEHGIYINDGEGGAICPTRARDIVDVCGAGDTVLAIASLGIAVGLDLAAIGILCNIGGGQVCESRGVVPVDKGKLWGEYLRQTNKIGP